MSNRETAMSTVSLLVSDIEGAQATMLHKVYIMKKLPINFNTITIINSINKWPHLSDIPIPSVDVHEVGLLIGQKYPELIAPLEVRRSEYNRGAPYAVKTRLGRTLSGSLYEDQSAPKH